MNATAGPAKGPAGADSTILTVCCDESFQLSSAPFGEACILRAWAFKLKQIMLAAHLPTLPGALPSCRRPQALQAALAAALANNNEESQASQQHNEQVINRLRSVLIMLLDGRP